MSIQRYNISAWTYTEEARSDGKWVKYDDHIAEVQRMSDEVERLRGLLWKVSASRSKTAKFGVIGYVVRPVMDAIDAEVGKDNRAEALRSDVVVGPLSDTEK